MSTISLYHDAVSEARSEQSLQISPSDNVKQSSSSSNERALDLNEEDEKLECDSVDELHTENINDNTLEKSKGYKRKRNSSSSIEHEFESFEELDGDTLIKDGALKRNNVGENYFDYLPDETILHIFHWLPQRYLNLLGLVCHRFNRLIKDGSLWAEVNVSELEISSARFWGLASRAIVLRADYCKIENSSLPPPLPSDFQGRLRYLDLSCTKICHSSLVTLLNQCVYLKKLSLEEICISDDVLFAISRNKDIEVLNLYDSRGLTHKGLKRLVMNCRKMKELNMSYTDIATGTTEYFCNNLPPSINKISVAGTYGMTDVCVANLVKRCPDLQVLNLLGCEELTKASVYHIINFKNLKVLGLRGDFSKFFSLSYLMGYAPVGDDREDLSMDLQNMLGPNVTIDEGELVDCIARPHVEYQTTIWDMKVQHWLD